jgi:ROK family
VTAIEPCPATRRDHWDRSQAIYPIDERPGRRTLARSSRLGSLRAGVDLGGTKIDVLIVEREREVIGRMRRPTPTDGGAAAVVDAIARTVTDADDDAAIRLDQLTGVGVGSPGAVDTAAGTVGFNSNLAAVGPIRTPSPRNWFGGSGPVCG